MDNCKIIKDIILTDYVDAQENATLNEQVERHLLICPACQSFAREVKEQLLVPLERSTRQHVPDQIWRNIQEEIYKEQQTQQGLLEKIQVWLGALSIPRLVPVTVSFVMILFVSSTLLFNQRVKQVRDKEAGVYLTYVMASETGTMLSDSNDFGTPIEKYFL